MKYAKNGYHPWIGIDLRTPRIAFLDCTQGASDHTFIARLAHLLYQVTPGHGVKST